MPQKQHNTQWFIEPLTTDTNTAIEQLKRPQGTHDDDYVLRRTKTGARPIRVWSVSFNELSKIMSDHSRGLKYTIYRQPEGHDEISRWEKPHRGDPIKIILPLISMVGGEEASTEAMEEIVRISRDRSTAQVSYLPAYVVLKRMMRSEKDKDQLSRGFKTILAMLMRGTYDEIALFGDTITPGMQTIILSAKTLHIPVIAKTVPTKRALAQLLG